MTDDVTLLRSIAMSVWFSSFHLFLFPLRFGFRTFPCFSFAGTLVGTSFFIVEKHRLIYWNLYRIFRIAVLVRFLSSYFYFTINRMIIMPIIIMIIV